MGMEGEKHSSVKETCAFGVDAPASEAFRVWLLYEYYVQPTLV